MLDDEAVVPLDDIQVDGRLIYIERAVVVVERNMEVLRNKQIHLVKVQWHHRKGSEWTWEPESKTREHYPELFIAADFEDEV